MCSRVLQTGHMSASTSRRPPEPATDLSEIPALAAQAREAFRSGRTKPLQWRLRQLRGVEALVVDEERELTTALADDLGKSNLEAYLTELALVCAEARHTVRHLRRWLRPKRVPTTLAVTPARAWTVLEPLGTSLIIGPWNYPVQLMLVPLIGAVAAGNSAVLKPSELAPATSRLLAELMPHYVDPDAVKVVEGGADETTALLAERWDHIFYTGGGRVARIIARAAAEHLTPMTLELGGKSPAYVDESVDLATTARRIVWAKFTNAGQTCIAPDYVLVTRDAAPDLERELGEAITEMFGPAPMDSPDYGRIVHARHFDRLVGMLGDGRVVAGGDHDRGRLRIAPTVLADVSADSSVMAEEIFGPILPLLVIDGPQQAIDFINERPKPLALSTFTLSRRVRRAFERNTSSGALSHGMAIAHASITELPFGGVGESGMGAYHGEQSVRAFSHEKPVAHKPLAPDTFGIAYPPYTAAKRGLLRRLM